MTMTTEDTRPRIYVASLSDYNAGILHGAWIDASDDLDTIREQISSMMALSPTAKAEGYPAEEYAIHDHEGFPASVVDEYTPVEYVHAVASVIVGHPEPDAVRAWIGNDPYVIEYNNADPDELAQAFDDAYRGCWPSLGDYAYQMAEDMGIETPDSWPFYCIDWDRAGRELEMGGDVWTAPAGGGEVYVFDGNAS